MEAAKNRITIRRPDDFHVHLRDGILMNLVLPFTTERFARAIVMPNLTPPVVTWDDVKKYRERICISCEKIGADFTPLMTLYLTDKTDPDDLREARWDGAAVAAKLYPAHATTNSSLGVTDIGNVFPTLSVMEEIEMPLLIHGELLRDHDGKEIDPFHREQRFISSILQIRARFPRLKIVFEHVTSAEAVQFVVHQHEQGFPTAATITPHHLLIDRRDLFRGGIRPDLYCLPIAKKKEDREALCKAATSGLPCFFAGTDSAPHTHEKKYCECGLAGIFNAHAALELYAEVFEKENAIHKLEAFTSEYGAKFYGLPLNECTITLIKHPWQVQQKYANIVPFRAGEDVLWRIDV